MVRGQRIWGLLIDRMPWEGMLGLRSSTQWYVDAGSRDAVGILSFWSDVERTQMGVECAGPGYISARLLLTPASLIEDVASCQHRDATGEAANASINEQLDKGHPKRVSQVARYELREEVRAEIQT